jgi:hypothetical protein
MGDYVITNCDDIPSNKNELDLRDNFLIKSLLICIGSVCSFIKNLIMETQEMTMTAKAVASRLAELCAQGKFEEAQRELFADDAISIEPHETPNFQKEIKGLDAIIEKGRKWESMVAKMNGLEVSKPLIATNSFALTMRMDVEMKDGSKWDMTELCVYLVKDGKIISEQFFM